MVTVKTEEEDMIRSFQQAHCDAHVGKPIIREKLLKTIEWVLKTKKRWEGDK
jgi:DNA-binding response OmpR family regulator